MTKESFEGWLSYQVTQEVKKLLEERIKNKVELMQELSYGCNDMETVAMQNARLAGMIAGINEFVEITWEDFQT